MSRRPMPRTTWPTSTSSSASWTRSSRPRPRTPRRAAIRSKLPGLFDLAGRPPTDYANPQRTQTFWERNRGPGVRPRAMVDRAPEGAKQMKRAAAAIATILALALVAPTMALAQAKDDKKVKTYDFSGDTIDGDLIKPDGEVVDTRDFASHSSLIRIRKDFIKEILKSAEDL